jgi:hypothetical protein
MGDWHAQQFGQPRAAAALTHGRFFLANEQFLFALAVGTNEFVERHGEE